MFLWALTTSSGKQLSSFTVLKDSLTQSTRSDYKTFIYEEYIKEFPQTSLGWELLQYAGLAYQQEGNYTKATELLEKSLKIYTGMEKYVKLDTNKLYDLLHEFKVSKGFADIESKALFNGKHSNNFSYAEISTANFTNSKNKTLFHFSGISGTNGSKISLYKLTDNNLKLDFDYTSALSYQNEQIKINDIDNDGLDNIIYLKGKCFVILSYDYKNNTFIETEVFHNRDLTQFVCGDINNDGQNEIVAFERQTIAPYDSSMKIPQEIYEATIPYNIVILKLINNELKVICSGLTGDYGENYVVDSGIMIGVFDFYNKKNNQLFITNGPLGGVVPSWYDVISFKNNELINCKNKIIYDNQIDDFLDVWPICHFINVNYKDSTYMICQMINGGIEGYCPGILKYNRNGFDLILSFLQNMKIVYYVYNNQPGILAFSDTNYYFIPLDRILK